MSGLVKNDSFTSYINLSMTEKTPEDVLEQYKCRNLASTGGAGQENVDTSGNSVTKLQTCSKNEPPTNQKGQLQSDAEQCNRLCGYLKKLKLGSRNIGKSFKYRWFVLAEESCTLLYFASAKDIAPLGEINIGKSVFTFLTDEAQNLINVFEIRSPNKVVLLQAEDNQTMLYWVQNLQLARKKYFMKTETHNFGLASPDLNINTQLCSPLISNIERPSNTIGESSAKNVKGMSRSKSLKDVSLANWKTELQNKFATIKINKNIRTYTINDNPNDNSTKIGKCGDFKPVNQNNSNQNVTLFKSNKTKSNDINIKSSGQNTNRSNSNMTKKISNADSVNHNMTKFIQKSVQISCSNCSKMASTIDEMKKNEVMLMEEMLAHDIITANLHKFINKLKQQLPQEPKDAYDNDDISEDDWNVHSGNLKASSRNIDLEELIVQLQANIVVKNHEIEEFKKMVDSQSEEIESLQLNLKMKNEMVMFLTKSFDDNNSKCADNTPTSLINISCTGNIPQQQQADFTLIPKKEKIQEVEPLQEELKQQQNNDGSLLLPTDSDVINNDASQISNELQHIDSNNQLVDSCLEQMNNNSPQACIIDSQDVNDMPQLNIVKQMRTFFEPKIYNKSTKNVKNIPLIPSTPPFSLTTSLTTMTTTTTLQSPSKSSPSYTSSEISHPALSQSSSSSCPSSTTAGATTTTISPMATTTTTISPMATTTSSSTLALNDNLISFEDASSEYVPENKNSNMKVIVGEGTKSINDNRNICGANVVNFSNTLSSKSSISTKASFSSSSLNTNAGEPWYVCDESSWHQHQDESLAYKAQNKMLNQEIMELNEFIQCLENKVDESQICVTKLDASLNHMNNKFLKCYLQLSELCTNEVAIVTSEKLKQIFEDNMEVDCLDGIVDRIRSKNGPVYDQYGFEKTLKRQDALVTQTSDGSENTEQVATVKNEMNKWKKSQQDMNLSLKWETMLISLERCLTFKNKEVKTMIREGIPNQFRARLWKVCIDVLIKDYRTNVSINSYSSILDMIANKTVVTPFANQIELDLLRTLPNNKHFSTFSSAKIISLRNILLAFSIHNPEIGYCQGLNRIVGILLLVLSEEEAFWGLVAMVEVAMPTNYYNRTLMAAHADQRVLKDVLAFKLPTLSQHFISLNFDPNLFTFSWFLTIFVDNLPVHTFMRIWDTFLYEGNKVLFRYALAIMKFYEGKILSFNTSSELNMFIRTMCENLTDINRLSQIAFNELNPFPMRMIRNKRVHHLNKLQMELMELDRLRQTFESKLSTSTSHADDEDDDSSSNQLNKMEKKYSSDLDEVSTVPDA